MKMMMLLIITGLILQSPCARTEPYTPASDTEILERLPVAAHGKQTLQELRSKLTRQPDDYRLALNLARAYITSGRTYSDPRFYGYAEAVLTPWLTRPYNRPDALVLRATILQNRHDFQAALADLNSALKLNPRLPQAWLTQAAIYEVQGDYPAALRSCMALARYSASSSAAACIHSSLSLSGQAQSSYQQLTAIVSDQGNPEELTWTYTLLAELAERLSLEQDAESWYRKALGQQQRSVYLLTSYADFLLDRNRCGEVVELLAKESQADALLLRLTLAEQRLRLKSFNGHRDLIQDRIAAAKARGDTVHQGDEARFNLYVLNNAQTALELAARNWLVQKEPRDARILLEAALAAKQPEAALPVIRFIEQTRLEDARLSPLLQTARG